MALNKILSIFKFDEDDFDDDELEETYSSKRKDVEDEAIEKFTRGNNATIERSMRTRKAPERSSAVQSERTSRVNRTEINNGTDNSSERVNVRTERAAANVSVDDYDYDYRTSRAARSERTSASKVVPIKSPRSGLEVTVTKPASFDSSQEICNLLIEGKAVIANLEGFESVEAQRIMDFISGCVYAMNGNLHQISKYIFIFSPENIDLSGDFLDTMSAQGFGIPSIKNNF